MMYKITGSYTHKHCMYDTFEDAAIDGINWYINYISTFRIHNAYALEIQRFIDAINNEDYHKALSIGSKITTYSIHIENAYPKKPLLTSFSDKHLKLINQYVKEEVFK
jgi:hypothetical protein